MAQISDVMHALAVFDAARQELAWAYSGDFTDVPEPMKGAVHTISEVLNEAEMRWVTSTKEEEPMAAAVDKENSMAVVATGHQEKREDVGLVKEVDTRSIGEAKKIKDWLLRLEKVACDMRAVAQKELLGDYSMIDDDKLSARCLPCLPRTSRAARIATIDTVARKLEELKKQYDEEFGYSTGLPLAATCTEQRACSSDASGQEETETSVTGDVLVEWGDDVKQRIIDIIDRDFSRNNKNIILPIVGPPCVGKTTLVKSLFHERSFGASYYYVWVNMRKGWDIKKILESIVDVLEQHGRGQKHIRELKSETDYDHYIDHIMWEGRERLFLVLDNLVEEQDSSMLEKLLIYLHGRIGSLVTAMVTTRSEALAKYITCFRGATVKPYRLHPSSDGMCWEIIKRTSGLDLEASGAGTAVTVSGMDRREIASKCSGIPLAAKALGRFLQSVDPQEWSRLIRDVWNIGGGFSRDSQELRRLPIHSATVFTHLKHSSGGVLEVGAESWLSLAYCAFVFPKGGHGVVTRDLLNQWCSLGITTRERGASCISELLDRSLLLGEKPASADGEDEILAATLLTMEDLMHDFARYHLGDRLIIVDGTNEAAQPTSSHVTTNNNNKSSGARLALITNFDAKQQLDITSILPSAGILALRFEACGEMELSKVEFASAKYACLRLLDLSGCSVNKKLPDSIRHLKQLRYLRAPGITGLSPDHELPRSITALHELRYLILRGSCQLKNLSEEFQRLSNLLYLDLSGCSGLRTLPDKFGRLWRLEHLDMSACSGIEKLPESLGWLPNLIHLDLSRCSGLQDLPTSFQYLTKLRHLDLSGWSMASLPMASLPRELRHLNLSCSPLLEKLPDAPEPNELRHLDLSECPWVSYLPSSYAKLEKLVHLNLSGCSRLVKLPRVGGPEGGEWTRKLEHLDLSHCGQLTDMPHNSDLPKLQYLDLLRCYRIREPPYLVISELVQTIRSRGGRASEPHDVRGLGTNGTTN